MNYNPGNIDILLTEYETLVHEARKRESGMDETEWDQLESILSEHGSWSNQGAAQLVCLVRRYGTFVLRNALALSLAAGIEDGDLGL